ncbi:hypothetical protein BpHYR1_049888 [Brachionus plicatilis]|uniref:RNA-directed DNA polymerase from mobile element jockey-like n=1 Tax=Brachionus plicatilis TaxID=10195 RepID=A0A3M7QGB9_BRAPC|nr:hypothetical protein BpHYR1_049888 [Brachionus plicatilis]
MGRRSSPFPIPFFFINCIELIICTAIITQKRKLALSVSSKLKALGIYTEHTCPYLKGHPYKTFIRPVLMYAMESINLKKTEINEMRRTQGNIVKKLIGVPIRCRTTNLLLSLTIDDKGVVVASQWPKQRQS